VISINVDTTCDREVTGEGEHTLECHDEMLKGLINRCYVPYHCAFRSAALHPEPEDDHGKLIGMLHKTILPPSANH
jgi:hypothetical protein